MVSFGVWPADTLSRTKAKASAKIVCGSETGAVTCADGGAHSKFLSLLWNATLMVSSCDLGDAAELVDEVHVPRLAAHLAVGRRLEADLALHADGFADRDVLHLRELLRAYRALRELVAGLEHLLRAKEATDVIGAEGRTGVVGHASWLLLGSSG